jgi:multiple sugar transport system substrate-binding protein
MMGTIGQLLKMGTISAFALALAAGCTSAGTPAAGTTTTDAKQAGSEQVTIKYIDWGEKEEHAANAIGIANFEKAHPNIKVDYQSIPYDQYNTKLSAMAASKTLPDLGNLLEAQALKWAESGVLLDLTPYYKDGSVKPKLESNKFTTPDGKVVGYSVANEVVLLHYNKDLFDEAKVPYPPAETEKAWTWDQMVDAAKKLTKDKNGKHPGESGFDPKNIVQYGIQMSTGADFFWTPFAISNGGGEVSQDGKQLLLDKPETIEAIQKVADLALVEYVSPNPAQAKSLPGDVGTKLFTKKVAMVESGQWELSNIGPQVSKGLRNGIGVLPIFKKPATTNTGTPLVIFNTSKHVKETVELYKFLMDPNNNLALIDNGTWMPAETQWYTDPELIKRWTQNPVHPPEYKTAVIDYALKATYPTPWFFLPTYGRISDVLNPGLDPVWLGTKTAKEAILNDIMPKVKPIFESGKAN